MKLTQALGLNVKRLRQARGLSQEALADAVDLAPTYVGKIDPTLAVVERMATAPAVDPLDLLRGDDTGD